MEKTDKAIGKAKCEGFFKIGTWYCFDKVNGNFDYKYLKITKLTFTDDRVFIKGTGFTELKGQLLNPTVKKEEIVCYVWADEYLDNHIWEIDEDEAMLAFDECTYNLKSYLFNI